MAVIRIKICRQTDIYRRVTQNRFRLFVPNCEQSIARWLICWFVNIIEHLRSQIIDVNKWILSISILTILLIVCGLLYTYSSNRTTFNTLEHSFSRIDRFTRYLSQHTHAPTYREIHRAPCRKFTFFAADQFQQFFGCCM